MDFLLDMRTLYNLLKNPTRDNYGQIVDLFAQLAKEVAKLYFGSRSPNVVGDDGPDLTAEEFELIVEEGNQVAQLDPAKLAKMLKFLGKILVNVLPLII